MRSNEAASPASPASNDNDLGFGNKIPTTSGRLLRPDGSFNVQRRGLRAYTPYQALVEMSWPKFLLLVFAFYLLVNAGFALGFCLIGLQHLVGIEAGSFLEGFLQAFFFSIQTFTTVGYGAISPVSMASNLLAAIVALVGLMSLALATGLFFARFSKPRARILFSRHLLYAPYRDTGLFSLQFRIANIRANRVINLRAQVVVSWFDDLPEGRQRRFAPLTLERSSVTLFPLNWTIVHIIDERSPLHGWTPERMQACELELLTLVEGFDETYAQVVHVNRSYTCQELVWRARFRMMYHAENGSTVLELDHIDDYILLDEAFTPG